MSFFKKLAGLFKEHRKIDDDFYDELEETLVMGDVGIEASGRIIEDLRKKVKSKWIVDADEAQGLLIDTLKENLSVSDEDNYSFENRKSVILVVGINGVGKTTTVGKLANMYAKSGKKVLLAAADTFRAAAIEQLDIWADRIGVDIINGREGGDPGAVIFDAVKAAKARNVDILICDTAGRLHNKTNLMNELKKLNSIIESEYPADCKETLVVVDGMTGQNALSQAREFKDATGVTGLIVTKLDGSAKGGIALTIQQELGIPIKFIGTGEGEDDIERFDPDKFINGIFERTKEAE
ncbi:MAG: signal recognition particle-docking protein FtsY [Lachnospiraceae bacterium]|nr:signal recognition particle-docking protein FtsY [Lachnospiraceae bacterium]